MRGRGRGFRSNGPSQAPVWMASSPQRALFNFSPVFWPSFASITYSLSLLFFSPHVNNRWYVLCNHLRFFGCRGVFGYTRFFAAKAIGDNLWVVVVSLFFVRVAHSFILKILRLFWLINDDNSLGMIFLLMGLVCFSNIHVCQLR